MSRPEPAGLGVAAAHEGTDHIYGGGGDDYYLSVFDGFPGDQVFGGAGTDMCVLDPADHGYQCVVVEIES